MYLVLTVCLAFIFSSKILRVTGAAAELDLNARPHSQPTGAAEKNRDRGVAGLLNGLGRVGPASLNLTFFFWK